MTGATFLLLALAAVAAVADWSAVHLERKPLEYLAKPLTLALLVLAALALEPADPTVRGWFVAALVCSLAGDVFLMLPRDLFVPGLASFLVGHLAYVAGMVADGLSPAPLGVGLVVVALAAAVVGLPILQAVRAGEEPALLPPVAVYMGVISAMVVCAFGTGHPVAIGGALLFYVSDALIAWNRFVRPTRQGPLAIITTYHLAQVGLVLSLL